MTDNTELARHIEQDIATVRAAIMKRWNDPGEVSSVLALSALQSLAAELEARSSKEECPNCGHVDSGCGRVFEGTCGTK